MPQQVGLADVVQFAGAIAAPTAFVTSLLYYFGRAQAKEEYGYFAIDHRLLGLSNTDYVLISVDAMFWPLIAGLSVGLLWFWAHRRILQALYRPKGWPTAAAIPPAIIVLGTTVTLGALYSVINFPPLAEISIEQYLLTPTGLAFGVATLGYGVYLRWRLRQLRAAVGPPVESPLPRLAVMTCFAVLTGLNIFWSVANYASATGRANAVNILRGMDNRHGVLLYTKERLGIDVTGVRETSMDDDALYRYRYSGLRLLIYGDEKYFLLPDTWSKTNAVTIIMPNTDAIRVAFVRGGSYEMFDIAAPPQD
jgi:hypothetical protein